MKNAALGQVNEEIPPHAPLERVEQLVVGQGQALLEYDTIWLGLVIEDLWIFAKLYLIVATSPTALVHHIDFEEEDAKSPLNQDYEEVNDERWLDEI